MVHMQVPCICCCCCCSSIDCCLKLDLLLQLLQL
jgi:hypothetical protein